MSIIYQRTFTAIGGEAREGFDAGFFILFANNEATDDMATYCFLHEGTPLSGSFSVGDIFIFAGKRFPVTAIGSNAIDNLRDLGHATLYFDGAEEAKLPGTVHLLGSLPKAALQSGSAFSIETF